MTYDPDNDHENSTLQAIFDAQREEDRAEAAMIQCREELKELKSKWEDARDRRVSLVRHADQRRLPMGND